MKYPFQPLEEILASRLNADPVFNNGQAWGATNHRIITFLRCSMTSLRKFRTEGLPEDTADRYAKLLGLHPFNIWPNWLQDLEVPCEDCGAPFVPSRKGHRFCRPACATRSGTRRRMREKRKDPEFRESEKIRNRTYYQETREYAKRKSTEHYWANRDRILAQRRARRREQSQSQSNIAA